MATALVSPPSQAEQVFKKYDNNHAPKNIFPDGIKTSGQHDPIASLLKSYKDFPEQIDGPTVWTRDDYVDEPEKWTHRFTDQEIEELGNASDDFIAAGIPLTGISQVGHVAVSLLSTDAGHRTTSRSPLSHDDLELFVLIF
jgi:hypothetical protein